MNISEFDIYNILQEGKSVLLVGPTESGKTWFICNKLIPFIKSKNETVLYIDGHIDDKKYNKADYVIVDEFETLLDKDYLQELHPEEKPYYEKEYISSINEWHRSLADISTSILFVLTRNEKKEIANIIQNIDKTDWGKKIVTFEYISSKKS